jgi:circadian clock protein KaiB
MDKVLLKLYITGHTPRSELAISNLQRICEERLSEQYQLDIIDILEQPHLAEQEKILATPTLVRLSPPPVRRLIGDLSDTEKVMIGLSLQGSSIEKTGGHRE